mgnify:CR=1 FL=1
MRLPVLQVVPPGFHLIPLPFRDDIRQPEADPALLARVAAGRTGPPRANEQQVGTDVDMADQHLWLMSLFLGTFKAVCNSKLLQFTSNLDWFEKTALMLRGY